MTDKKAAIGRINTNRQIIPVSWYNLGLYFNSKNTAEILMRTVPINQKKIKGPCRNGIKPGRNKVITSRTKTVMMFLFKFSFIPNLTSSSP